MKRPLIAVALFYVGGILLAALPIPLLPLFVVAFVLVLLFVVWSKARLVLLCVLIVLTGWINLARRTTVLSPHDLRNLLGDRTPSNALRGTLRETPYHRVHKSLTTGVDLWSTIAEIEVTQIRLRDDGEWQPAFGRVITTTPGIVPDSFFAGQQIEVGGALRPARGPVAEGLFDYRAYLAHQGIYYELPVERITDWQILASPRSPPLADRFCAWARKTLARGLPVEDESLRLEWALTLGWKAALTDDVAEPFMRAAT
jgi:predicted membrane metal-binding protein